ncbi:MAG: hypothetical protein II767_00285 [Proteobacteria bacterium]|nr:hypothetical protein [Pseudomonadota bacterium]
MLDIDFNGHLLIVSDKVLFAKSYNHTDISVKWEKSTIRSWLNGYDSSYNTSGFAYTSNNNFIDRAFTPEEKARIIESNVPAHPNPYYNTPAGKATTDKIFLLSVVEARYFTTNQARKAYATLYAIHHGADAYYGDTGCTANNTNTNSYHVDKCLAVWWLRSPGEKSNSAAIVNLDGMFQSSNVYEHEDNSNFYNRFTGVRPALWLNL